MEREISEFLEGFSEVSGTGKNPVLADLVERLREIWIRSRGAWPEFEVGPREFGRFLAERIAADDVLASLAAMPVEDLYLACACAMGCSRAIDCFHRAYFPDAEAALAAIHAPHLVEEVRQMADEKLFVSRDGNPPRISDYEGQGALRTWFRVIALRLAISLLRKTRKEEPLEDELLLALPARFGDPEFDLIRSHREDFKEAFGEAVAQLPAREKTLLRMHLVDGVSIRQLGDIHRVHPSTVFRWIDRAKAEVARHIRRSLEIRLGLTRAQLESLLEEVRSQLDLSLERVLNQNS